MIETTMQFVTIIVTLAWVGLLSVLWIIEVAKKRKKNIRKQDDEKTKGSVFIRSNGSYDRY